MGESAPQRWENGLSPRQDRQSLYLAIHHVPIFVRDQDRSLRFYMDQLGFSLVIDYHFEGHGRFVLVAPPDGTTLLALVAPKPESEEYKLIGRPAPAVFVTEDITAKFHAWRDAGVRFRHPPLTGAWGGTFTSFEDLDGNFFVLAGWDDLTREVAERRRTIAEKLEWERRAAQELEIAKQVQSRLFPQAAPRVQTLDYAGACLQARDVGGDYYDFLDLGRERLGIVVGDISGKGIAAALLMANLQANLRSQCAIASDQPQRFLRSVNRLFFENTTDSAYATVFFAEFDDRKRRLRYANCGHVPGLLLRRDDTIERLHSTSPVLGIFKDWECAIREQTLSSGDTLLLYTDGIIESFNDAGEEFGESRLIEVASRYHDMAPQTLLAAIIDEVRKFSGREQHDDITLIIAKCR
jgi:serine phosphatase RsbU (regulator of sigma subunit)